MIAEPELLNKRLERLAMVLDEIMPNCASLVRDALELLKEQEPKQVVSMASIEGMEVGHCPSCDRAIINKKTDKTKFCRFCGQAVKWDA